MADIKFGTRLKNTASYGGCLVKGYARASVAGMSSQGSIRCNDIDTGGPVITGEFGQPVAGPPYEIDPMLMTPIDVGYYWLDGHGGTLEFPAGSVMSELFKKGEGANKLEYEFFVKVGLQKATKHKLTHRRSFSKADVLCFNEEAPEKNTRITDVDYDYSWFFRSFNKNLAVQFVGTWKGEGRRMSGDTLYYQAKNTVSWNSLLFGNARSKFRDSMLEMRGIGGSGELAMTMASILMNPNWLNKHPSNLEIKIYWERSIKEGLPEKTSYTY